MRRGLRAALAVLLSAVLCVLCNALAFLIDTDAMRENAWQGALMLGEQLAYPQMVGGFSSAQLDNFTSVLILKTAAYTGEETLWQKALGGLRAEVQPEGADAWTAFCTYADGSQSPGGGLSYSRYWHGYTLPLRLLLCVMNLSNIQMTLLFLQLALLCAVVVALLRRRLGALLPGFFTAYFLLMPAVCGLCLQYAPVSLTMLAACLCVLLADEALSRAVGMPAFFALVGLLTNYLDLLTFPLITLGFPLVLLLALRMRAGDSFRALLSASVLCCLGWALGYFGLWALKFALVGACFGWARLAGIFEQAALRVSAASGGAALSRVGVLMENARVLLAKPAYLLLGALGALATLAGLFRRRPAADARALAFIPPAAAVLVWYLAMANHSHDHAYYTYRSLCALLLCGYALLAGGTGQLRRSDP